LLLEALLGCVRLGGGGMEEAEALTFTGQ
jgi:hypothetical protein